MNLFQSGHFVLNSGLVTDFKIDCDALADDDIETIALLLAHRLPFFSAVEGVPRGGLRLAAAMKKFTVEDGYHTLIVDDVFTTGGSIERQRAHRVGVIGAVIFARGETPAWITPLFRLEP